LGCSGLAGWCWRTHDDWLPGFSVDTDVGPIRDELARVAPDTTLVELGYVDGTIILP
jgi:hypothetical protein